MLKTYRLWNSTVRFSNFEFYNKLLGGVTLLRVTSGITLNNVTLLKVFWLDANFDKFTVRLHYLHIFSILTKFWGNQILIAMSWINFLNSSFCSLK